MKHFLLNLLALTHGGAILFLCCLGLLIPFCHETFKTWQIILNYSVVIIQMAGVGQTLDWYFKLFDKLKKNETPLQNI